MTLILVLLAVIAAGILLGAVGLLALGRWLQGREPYQTILKLRTRQKLSFFKRLLTHRRVPWAVKLVPLGLVLYLATPIDLVPDFLPVIGYLDDVAIALAAAAVVIKFTPGWVIDEIIRDLTWTESGEWDGPSGIGPRFDSPK